MVKKTFFSFLVLLAFSVSLNAAPQPQKPELQKKSEVEQKTPDERLYDVLYKTNMFASCSVQVEQALKDGADANKQYFYGAAGAFDYPLHAAVHFYYDGVALTKLLLEYGAEIEKRCSAGQTPLFVAVKHRNVAAAQFLLEKGAEVNTRSKWLSPLLVAVKNDDEEMVKLLLEWGASLKVWDEAGKTVFNLWQSLGIFNMLHAAQAQNI
ncbi:ankyrin repeat domain-containing protein [Candidatus Babeliales bacterium]|nr:ankyrin repeat domain-containing protein [Candidatus Babeliales bacterium]